MPKINKRIVTIVKVDKTSITHNEGLSASIDLFPGAKVGQKWELTTDDAPPYILGVVKKAVLIKEAS